MLTFFFCAFFCFIYSFYYNSLQEPCFKINDNGTPGRHLAWLLLLTLPQLFLYVLGLPLLSAVVILRNKDHLHEDKSLGHKHPENIRSEKIRLRFGLLYMGYRPGREWWELVVALRKVAIVAIGTFGTLLGVVDLQGKF